MRMQYESLENTVGGGEIAHYEQFLLFPQCFLPVLRTFCHIHQIWNCRLQTLSVWKCLKFVVWERIKQSLSTPFTHVTQNNRAPPLAKVNSCIKFHNPRTNSFWNHYQTKFTCDIDLWPMLPNYKDSSFSIKMVFDLQHWCKFLSSPVTLTFDHVTQKQ